MHQHPRRAPATASPASSPTTNPTRTNNPRDPDKPPSRAGSDRDAFNEQGYSAGDGGDAMLRAPETSAQGTEVNGKMNQIVQNYFLKAALTVLSSRIPLPPVYYKDNRTRRLNKWFNVEIDETDALRDYLRTWRACDAVNERPPPMVIETFIRLPDLAHSQSLVFIDDKGKRWDVEEAINASPSSSGSHSDGTRPEVIVERWIVQLGGKAPQELPTGLGTVLPRVYKNTIVLFRSLFTCTRLFPAWKLSKKLLASRSPANTPKLRFRISQDPKLDQRSQRDTLTLPLCDSQDGVVENHTFEPIDTPAGPFSIHVTYRTSCDFRLADSEAFLSSRFMGMDEYYDRPSPRRLGSAPTRRQYMTADDDDDPPKRERPSLADHGQAYGSLSTFHQSGQPTGTSPISALRAAQIAASESPEDYPLRKERPSTRSGQESRSSLRLNETSSGVGRRPSVSFTPFKAPSLSASPSQAEPTSGSYPRGSSFGKSSPLAVLAEARHPSGPIPPRGSPKGADHSRTPSVNSSKPPAPQRFSSSFGHRKARPSTGGGSKTEDDTSSGKASASSSAAAQPGSGVLAEGGTSSGSIQTDDDNISDFLKMLDQKKELRSFKPPPHHAPSEASSRRTVAALSKFQRMRDSNAALSESMSSSLMLHRSSSSSSRQLASVPPMIAGTSISTSSSPGKPISPHTPHTPAIPSRLSAQYPRADSSERRRDMTISEQEQSQEPEEPPPPGAIAIPSSPRIRQPSYRRSSSARQGPRNVPFDDDEEIFPFMRSASLGFDDRPPPSRSALVGLQDDLNRDECAVAQPSVENRPTFGPPLALPEHSDTSMERQRSSEGQDSGDSYGRRGFPYRPHMGRGRGDAAFQESSSSLVERGSHSGSSDQRGGRYSFSRPHSTFEDEEPLLFAMSDLSPEQQSRRSREDLRGGLHGGADSAGSSRRGSRRGGS